MGEVRWGGEEVLKGRIQGKGNCFRERESIQVCQSSRCSRFESSSMERKEGTRKNTHPFSECLQRDRLTLAWVTKLGVTCYSVFEGGFVPYFFLGLRIGFWESRLREEERSGE